MDAVRRKTIHEAMVRLSDGDRSAMKTLVHELWPVVLSFAQRGLPDAADAEDAAQEVFLKICSRITDFDRSRDGLSWAFAIAHFEVLTLRRRRQRRRESAAIDVVLADHADSAPSQEEAAIQIELDALVLAVAGKLSAAERESLGLVESARSQPASNAALRKRKQRALDRFRAVWRKLHGEF